MHRGSITLSASLWIQPCNCFFEYYEIRIGFEHYLHMAMRGPCAALRLEKEPNCMRYIFNEHSNNSHITCLICSIFMLLSPIFHFLVCPAEGHSFSLCNLSGSCRDTNNPRSVYPTLFKFLFSREVRLLHAAFLAAQQQHHQSTRVSAVRTRKISQQGR